MMRILIFGCIGLGVLSILNTSCKPKQVAPKEDFTFKHYQSISLDLGDSLVQFNLSENPEKIETDLSKDYYWFKIDKITRTQGQYGGKLLDGEYKVVNQKDKSVMSKGAFDEGLMSGRWVSWYPNGKIKEVYTYKKGVKDGEYLLQNSLGQILEKGSFTKGRLEGLREYYGEDTVLMTIKYKKGIPVDTIP
ncbi:MAG: hypothetical protein ABJF04_23070 [Reichenbachiella sp.]|uniref:toxin-antitoxin system YwqK family antitoxin n=1 Tax=Reichenbachiella sp. TaxID=2184521 RepID=UPI003266E495